ncbi:hypothetical protein ACFX13_025638 [Malus domestica]
MDSSQSQQRRGGLVSLSPSQMLRSSDKSVRDLRSGDSNSTNRHEKENGVNVQVLVRCRPLHHMSLWYAYYLCHPANQYDQGENSIGSGINYPGHQDHD